MAISKVTYNGETLIDLTGDTVTTEVLLQGYTATDATGKKIDGTAVVPTKVSQLENDAGYLTEADKTVIIEAVLQSINGGIPNEYEIVEYIESDGNSLVDTGFIPNKDTRIDMVAMSMTDAETSYNDGTVLYGSGIGYNNSAFECYGSKGQYEFNYNNQNPYLGTLKSGEIITISHNKNAVNLYTPTDGQLTLELTYGEFTVPYTMYLFAINRGNVSFKGKVRIYSCQIYDTGTLIRSYVPVRRKADNALGMFDTVNRIFTTNAGTGTFTAG